MKRGRSESLDEDLSLKRRKISGEKRPNFKDDDKMDLSSDNIEALSSMKFRELCKLFHHLTSLKRKKRNQRNTKIKEILQRHFKKWLLENHDVYPIVRLMIPNADPRRARFGIREKTLGRVYIDVYGLTETEKGSISYHERFTDWKKEETRQSFSEIARDFIRNKAYGVGNEEEWTVEMINGWMDELADLKKKRRGDRKKLFSKLAYSLTPKEHRWLCSIILGKMDINANEKTVLGALNKHALDIFNKTTDLEKVCKTIREYSQAVVDSNGRKFLKFDEEYLSSFSIELFSPVRPMLARNLNDNQINSMLSINTYIIEPKFDGERVMIHFQRTPLRIEYFSRNGNCTSHIYGGVYNEAFIKAVGSNVSNCIVDGEMLVFDTVAGVCLEFGKNRDAKVRNNPRYYFVYKCFDIVFRNGVDQTKGVLTKRKNVLRESFPNESKRFELVKGWDRASVKSMATVYEKLKDAIQDNKEGLILKDLGSTYGLDERANRWIKVKPVMKDALDLLVVGGYFGTKFKDQIGKNSITHFIMGVFEDSTKVPKDRNAEVKEVLKVVPVVKVGSGYNCYELLDIQAKLKDHWKPFDLKNNPECREMFPNWNPVGQKYTPDFYVLPQNSIVMKIMPEQIVDVSRDRRDRGPKYPVDRTFRFARVKKSKDKKKQNAVPITVREDKDWNEVIDLNEYYRWVEIQDSKEEKVKQAGRRITGFSNINSARVMGLSLPSHLRCPDYTKVERGEHSDLFRGVVAYVCKIDEEEVRNLLDKNAQQRIGEEYDKSESVKHSFELFIHKNGGSCVANPVTNLTHYIASSWDDERVKKQKERIENGDSVYSDTSIMTPKFFFDWKDGGDGGVLKKEHFLWLCADQWKEYCLMRDRYGDSYSEKLSSEQAREIIENVKPPKLTSTTGVELMKQKYNMRNMQGIREEGGNEEEEEEAGITSEFMSDVVCYLDRYVGVKVNSEAEETEKKEMCGKYAIARSILESHGATVVEAIALRVWNSKDYESRKRKYEMDIPPKRQISHIIVDRTITAEKFENFEAYGDMVRSRFADGYSDDHLVKVYEPVFVTIAWLKACEKQGMLVPTLNYEVRVNQGVVVFPEDIEEE